MASFSLHGRESFDDGIADGAEGARALAEVAERTQAEGDTDLALNLLAGAGVRCWWSEPGNDARELVVAVAERMIAPEDEPRLLASLSWAAPVRRGAVERLSRLEPERVSDPAAARLYGMAATCVGEHQLASGISWRLGGRLARAGQTGSPCTGARATGLERNPPGKLERGQAGRRGGSAPG